MKRIECIGGSRDGDFLTAEGQSLYVPVDAPGCPFACSVPEGFEEAPVHAYERWVDGSGRQYWRYLGCR